MDIKPYYVFTVEDQSYLIKLLSNRVDAISQEESDAFLLFQKEQKPLDEALLHKYHLAGSSAAWETQRRTRWDHLFSNRRLYCLELMMAQECNMRCDYCYGDAHFGGSGLMSFETAKRALDWLLRTTEAETYPHGAEILISFFGGEPLLNYEVVRQSIAYVWEEQKRRDIVFSMTTNLSLLTDEMLDFMCRYPMGLCISFDGRMQHRYRRFANGEDSYDKVAENIRRVLAVMPDASGRATLYGDGRMDEMADDLWDMGFRRGYINAASGSLIKGTVLQTKEQTYRELTETYPALTRRYLTAIKQRDEQTYRRISFDSEFMQSVGYGWNPSINMLSCGCGRTLLSVDVNGDIYPCHRFVGVPEMKLGNIDTPYRELKDEMFAEHITFVNPECQTCFLRFTCGGSCMHENYCDASTVKGEPSIHIPFAAFCQYRRLAARLAIHVEHSLDDGDKAWLRMLKAEREEGVSRRWNMIEKRKMIP